MPPRSSSVPMRAASAASTCSRIVSSPICRHDLLEEAAHDHPLGGVGVEPARLGVEQLGRVDRAGRGAVAAAQDVVRLDLEHRDRLRAGFRAEQEVAALLVGAGLLASRARPSSRRRRPRGPGRRGPRGRAGRWSCSPPARSWWALMSMCWSSPAASSPSSFEVPPLPAMCDVEPDLRDASSRPRRSAS